MNKDIHILFEKYKSIFENDNISNNMAGSDVSTKFQTDAMARFLPVGQDDEEEKKMLESEKLRIKMKDLFTSFNALISAASKETVTYKEISKLIEFLDNPQVKGDLEKLKNALQAENIESGANASLSS